MLKILIWGRKVIFLSKILFALLIFIRGNFSEIGMLLLSIRDFQDSKIPRHKLISKKGSNTNSSQIRLPSDRTNYVIFIKIVCKSNHVFCFFIYLTNLCAFSFLKFLCIMITAAKYSRSLANFLFFNYLAENKNKCTGISYSQLVLVSLQINLLHLLC